MEKSNFSILSRLRWTQDSVRHLNNKKLLCSANFADISISNYTHKVTTMDKKSIEHFNPTIGKVSPCVNTSFVVFYQ